MDFWTSTVTNDAKKNENPAEPEAETSSWGWGGLSGLVDTVKKQSESIIQMYKEDIQEFTKVISEDTTEAIKKGAKNTDLPIPDLGNVLGIKSAPSKPKTPVPVRSKEEKIAVRPYVAKLLSMQSDLSTYKLDPSDETEFQEWKSKFAIAEKTDEISKILATNEEVRYTHERLVPVEVKYGQFWERYFYKLEKLNQEENRRKEIVKKAGSDMDEEELGWDEDLDSNEEEKAANSAGEEKEVEDYFEKLDVEEKEEKHVLTEPQQQFLEDVREHIHQVLPPVEEHQREKEQTQEEIEVKQTSPKKEEAKPEPVKVPKEAKEVKEVKEVKTEKKETIEEDGDWDSWE